MTDSRTEILNAIQRNLNKTQHAPIFKNTQPPVDLPSMHFTKEQCVSQFILKATKAHATIHQVESALQIPTHVSSILQKDQILVRAKTALLETLDWSTADITVQTDYVSCNEQASINDAFCSIAETGTLVMLSSHESPTALNFLPQIQFICLKQDSILNNYEAAWHAIQQHGALPRCINFITGPSCTGDIEQEILWGAHGPKQLHIILYKET